jgi:hypothetical protein
MKLLTLKIVSRGINGWESPLLHFGQRTTSLYAPNGSGKTPIVQAIAFCLGFNTKFRADVRERCLAAALTFEHDDVIYEAQRDLTTEHFVLRFKGNVFEYFSEGDFSEELFKILGLNLPELVSTTRQLTKAYVSTLLPIFYVRQDGGYISAYTAPATFITDQFVEMIRFSFGLNPKRSYTAKRDLLEAKDQLDSINRKLITQQKVIGDLSKSVDDSIDSRETMKQRSEWIASHINELKDSVNAEGAANATLTELLNYKEEKIRASRRLHGELRARISGIESIRNEIEGEIKTLSLNEESKRLFESFSDICARPDCGLFMSSSESYGKNLLYLKDQIKDLKINTSRAEIQLIEIEHRLSEEEQERDLITSKISLPLVNNTTAQIVTAVQSLTKELIEVEQQLSLAENLRDHRKKYLQLEDDRSKTQDRIALLNDNGRADIEFNKMRLNVRDLVVKWMDILKTPNASRDIEIDLDFKFRFGVEPLEAFTGSTKVRLILAIHAAIFEAYLINPKNPFRFLILDTPKQHELNTEDLAKYLEELQSICDSMNGQILISSTEYHHIVGEADIEWLPQYPGVEQNMYLGNPANLM